MSSRSILENLIKDLKRIRAFCIRKNLEYVPDIGMRYVVGNHDAIAFYLKQVYSKLDQNQRAELSRQHKELDYSAISDDFYDIAANPISDAKQYWPHPLVRAFGVAKEDHIHMVIRVLEYAKYGSLDEYSDELAMSPISQYGLENYFDPEPLAVEDVQAIQWEISDILYHEKKKETLEECKSIGVDFEQHKMTFSNNTFPVIVDLTTAALINLLKHKLDYDLALVIIGAPKAAGKYSRYISNRLYEEFLKLLVDFRQSIEHVITFFSFEEPVNLTRGQHLEIGMRAEKHLEVLKEKFESLRSKISTVQPSPKAYSEVSQLIKRNDGFQPSKKEYSFTIGELTMGDKYDVGQAGAVGPGSHAHDMNFNQIWNQVKGDLCLSQLVEELSRLREALLEEAKNPEQYTEIGAVASAEIEAKNGQGSKVLEYLSKTGKWVLDVATKIGTTLAAAAIKESLGIK